MREEEYKRLPNRFVGRCFGCSPDNPSGLQMEFKAGDESVVSTLTVPDHLSGWSNMIHGGVLMTILDEVMSWSAIYFLKTLVMTQNMNIDFVKSAYVGKELKAEGRLIEVVRRHQALMEGVIYDENGDVCAKSTATFATFSVKVGKRLGIVTKDHPEWFK